MMGMFGDSTGVIILSLSTCLGIERFMFECAGSKPCENAAHLVASGEGPDAGRSQRSGRQCLGGGQSARRERASALSAGDAKRR